MEDKEKDRAARAKKEMKAYEDSRKKWAKRLANLKLLIGIVVIGLCTFPDPPSERLELVLMSSPPQSRGHLPGGIDLLCLCHRAGWDAQAEG
jgi:hypothetical protein